LRPQLKEKVGLTISFFCAGSPATKGTVELLKSMGIDPGQVQELRYRGNGWPGHFAGDVERTIGSAHQKSYKESWGFLQAYRPYSVHLLPRMALVRTRIFRAAIRVSWSARWRSGFLAGGCAHGTGAEIIRKGDRIRLCVAGMRGCSKASDFTAKICWPNGAVHLGRLLAFKMFGLPANPVERIFSFLRIGVACP